MWLKKQEITSSRELYEVWHKLKFICQEVDEKFARELGHRMANFPKDVSGNITEEIKGEMLEVLRKPSDVKRIKHWLWKNYTHLKKAEGIELEKVCPPETLRNMTYIAEEMLAVELKVREKEAIFGSSPINYKPSR